MLDKKGRLKKFFIISMLTVGIILGLLSEPIGNPFALGFIILGTPAIGFIVNLLKDETKDPCYGFAFYGFSFSLSFCIALIMKSFATLLL